MADWAALYVTENASNRFGGSDSGPLERFSSHPRARAQVGNVKSIVVRLPEDAARVNDRSGCGRDCQHIIQCTGERPGLVRGQASTTEKDPKIRAAKDPCSGFRTRRS